MARSDEKSQSKKRPAEGDPDGAQPLTKRFGCLQIDHDASRTKYDAPYSDEPDAMLLDDTKHTTYIYNLDQELAEPESTGNGLVLLPLAAKMISVPNSVLSSNSAQGKELVLYTEPASLTLPKEKDSVRKAIIESRARTRASQPSSPRHIDIPNHPLSAETLHDDPMDIDLGPQLSGKRSWGLLIEYALSRLGSESLHLPT